MLVQAKIFLEKTTSRMDLMFAEFLKCIVFHAMLTEKLNVWAIWSAFFENA